MTHIIKLFAYDVIRLGISKERRSFYGSCDYEFGPLYRNFNQMKTAALEIGQQLNPNGREVLWIPHLTEDQLMANGCEAAYNLSIRNEEEKTDIILVLRALFADRDVQNYFYSYHLSRLSIPPMPTKPRMHADISALHRRKDVEKSCADEVKAIFDSLHTGDEKCHLVPSQHKLEYRMILSLPVLSILTCMGR